MSYELLLHREAQKELLNLPSPVYQRVYNQLTRLEQEPRPRAATKLKGRDNLWRIRLGRYRLIYHVDDDAQILTVLRVVVRDESTYRGL